MPGSSPTAAGRAVSPAARSRGRTGRGATSSAATRRSGLARAIASLGVPYVAFGGGEPLGVPFCWDIFELLSEAGVALKLETDGTRIDVAAAERLARMRMECIQISVDGANAATYERMRPGLRYEDAIAAIERLVARGLSPQLVFVPSRFNLHEIVPAFELAARLGCGAFVTGPLMRIGRAAAHWDDIACSEAEWHAAAAALRARAASLPGIALSIYPWDIVTEMERRLEGPQAMLLVVPNGKVKLLNALPFAPADLRRHSVAEAWDAYRAGVARPGGARIRRRAAARDPSCCAMPTRPGRWAAGVLVR